MGLAHPCGEPMLIDRVEERRGPSLGEWEKSKVRQFADQNVRDDGVEG